MLDESERFALLSPGEGETGAAHQSGGVEILRMIALEDGLRDIGSEEGQSKEPRVIGSSRSKAPGHPAEIKSTF